MHDLPPTDPTPGSRHRPSRPTVFAAAFVAGAVAAFGMNSFFDARMRQTRPVVECEPIFVALRSLPQGAPVTVWDVALRDWPRAMLPATALRAADRFEGLLLRHPLREGQPLLSVQLAEPAPAEQAGPRHLRQSMSHSGAEAEPEVEQFAAPVPVVRQPEEPPAGLAPGREAPADEAAVAPARDAAVASANEAAVASAREAAVASAREAAVASAREAAVAEPAVSSAVEPVAEGNPAIESFVKPNPAVAPSDQSPPPAIALAPALEPAGPIMQQEPQTEPDFSWAAELEPAPALAGVAPTIVAPTIAAPTIAAPAIASEPPVSAPPEASAARDPAPMNAIDPRIFRSDFRPDSVALDPGPVALAPVLPLPPVDIPRRLKTQPPLPPTPSSDIEVRLAVVSRQRTAQTLARRPESVIAAIEAPAAPSASASSMPNASAQVTPSPAAESLAASSPVAPGPASDVAGAISGMAAARPAMTSQPLAEQHTETRAIVEPQPQAPPASENPAAETAENLAVAPPQPPLESIAVPLADGTEAEVSVANGSEAEVSVAEVSVAEVSVVAVPLADTAAAPAPLKHLVVPERIAVQAERSFVAAEPPVHEEPLELTDQASDRDRLPAQAAPIVGQPQPGSAVGKTRQADGQPARPQAPRSASESPADPDASSRGGRSVLRAIGSLFQGFSNPASPPASRR